MRAALAAALVLALGSLASAQSDCRGESFPAWLDGVRAEASRAGMSQRALASLDGLTPDPRVLNRDTTQAALSQSFLDFVGKVVSADRLARGQALMQRHADTLARIERDYGVAREVVVALWGLETDYGAYTGDFSALRSLATLAYDCRRPDYFRAELFDALTLLSDGDLTLDEMRGAWAGELGQVQFTPSNYRKYAIDFDGDGRRDLVGSVPDALASTASFLRALGWRANEGWLEEVRVGAGVPWAEAAREILKPRSFWAAAGVVRADGSALPADAAPSALILPMGRLGPAFLAYPNFLMFWEWNQSSNYALSAAYFATRLAGAPRLNRGNALPILPSEQMRELQERLNAAGYAAGDPDGRLGEITRAGVKRAQQAFGLPPDGYPTPDLLQRLRGG